MTCKWCHDNPYSDYECFCGCHFADRETVEMGLKRCDEETK